MSGCTSHTVSVLGTATPTASFLASAATTRSTTAAVTNGRAASCSSRLVSSDSLIYAITAFRLDI